MNATACQIPAMSFFWTKKSCTLPKQVCKAAMWTTFYMCQSPHLLSFSLTLTLESSHSDSYSDSTRPGKMKDKRNTFHTSQFDISVIAGPPVQRHVIFIYISICQHLFLRCCHFLTMLCHFYAICIGIKSVYMVHFNSLETLVLVKNDCPPFHEGHSD